jgi:hypothetical protein
MDSLACWPGGMLSDTGSPAYSVDLSTLFGETYLPEGPQTWFILPIRRWVYSTERVNSTVLLTCCHYDNNGMADLVLCATIGEKHRKTQL